ncbi:FliH/SctL family protein [Bacterioplanoides sp.]|uniref:FliH/SctL family protein n=1 Tax=Bacterioplanoides sp. TaxID=2066072 RepID=UPI003B5A7D20
MTELRQNHHFHPIAKDEVKEDVKPWRLPFWTEKPAWLVEKEEKEQQQKEQQQAEAEPESFPMPTAEELENIRRDAYNAGLEQGLVEGRQQGEKQGYEQGFAQGLEEGRAKGEQEGRQQGFDSGEAQGLEQGQQQIQQACEQLSRINQHLRASVIERDQQLPIVVCEMIRNLSSQVLQHELSLGNLAMEQFIRDALQELPGTGQAVKVYLNAADISHLDRSGFDTETMHFHSDPALAAGDCRIETEQTLIEYSVSEKLNAELEVFIPQLLKAAENSAADLDLDNPLASDNAE